MRSHAVLYVLVRNWLFQIAAGGTGNRFLSPVVCATRITGGKTRIACPAPAEKIVKLTA
jgi:hypothetical protein